jgi:hypothetical protein
MVEILPLLMIGFAALIDRGLGIIGRILVGAVSALSFFVQLTSILVSYVPYLSLMDRAPGGFRSDIVGAGLFAPYRPGCISIAP